MNLAVKKLDLFWDGELPRDSMAGDRHRHVFCEAKPLIDYAFKVEKPAFVRVWWFDRMLDQVFDVKHVGRPRKGQFYMPDLLLSDTDRYVADYLSELGWQVRLTVKSIKRQEYITLSVFSAQGAILEDDESYKVKVLEEQGLPPIWPVLDDVYYRTKEIAEV